MQLIIAWSRLLLTTNQNQERSGTAIIQASHVCSWKQLREAFELNLPPSLASCSALGRQPSHVLFAFPPSSTLTTTAHKNHASVLLHYHSSKHHTMLMNSPRHRTITNECSSTFTSSSSCLKHRARRWAVERCAAASYAVAEGVFFVPNLLVALQSTASYTASYGKSN